MYIVLEIQINNDLTLLSWSFNNKNEAEAKYYTILSVAALSTIPKHGAVLLAENGCTLLNQIYTHPMLEENDTTKIN